MTTIPLFSVAAFLRHHNALQVLEGAPIILYPAHPGDLHQDLHAIRPTDLTDARKWGGISSGVLYLGTDAVCPAALGWAARVLSRTQQRLLPDRPHSLGPGIFPDMVALWEVGRSTGSKGRPEADYTWAWMEGLKAPQQWAYGIYLPGQAPTTPAERLKAVLLYELEHKP